METITHYRIRRSYLPDILITHAHWWDLLRFANAHLCAGGHQQITRIYVQQHMWICDIVVECIARELKDTNKELYTYYSCSASAACSLVFVRRVFCRGHAKHIKQVGDDAFAPNIRNRAHAQTLPGSSHKHTHTHWNK